MGTERKTEKCTRSGCPVKSTENDCCHSCPTIGSCDCTGGNCSATTTVNNCRTTSCCCGHTNITTSTSQTSHKSAICSRTGSISATRGSNSGDLSVSANRC